MVYVRTIDWPSVYGKVEKRIDSSGMPGVVNAKVEGGQGIYVSTCQSCHGTDRTGGIGPQLLNLKGRFNFKKFQQLVTSGKGEMPAFSHLDEGNVKKLFDYLLTASANVRENKLVNNKPADMKPAVITGPVVASGGAPGGQQLRQMGGPGRGGPRGGQNGYGIPYPKDVSAPADRYFIPPGWGLGFPYLITPPWSSIVAYDMNTGTIKWTAAIGQDLKATNEGGKNTGVLRSQRNGMIVTSSGLLFCTARDGKIYAFDADNGKQLWAGQLPTGTQGLPSMYEVNGKHYLVVSATTPIKWGREDGKPDPATPVPQGGYVVFALP
jgi:quinoprotein glucose dehydrogenase